MSAPIAETVSRAVDGDGKRKAPSDGQADLDAATLDNDELFHLLQSERRRRAIRYLLAAESETIIMRDVAEAVAAEEYETSVTALGSEERQRVYITLYQSHLPQLADAGVITYDQSRGEITTTPLIEAFETHLSDRSSDEGNGKKGVWGTIGFGLGTLLTLALVSVLGAGLTMGITLLVMAAGVAMEFGLANEFELGSS